MLLLSLSYTCFLARLASALSQTPGCGNPLPPGEREHRAYNATIGDRRYLYYIPINYEVNGPNRLFMVYHGTGANPEHQRRLDWLTNPEYNTNAIVVFPEGTSREGCEEDDSCEERYWSIDPTIEADDVQFTDAVMEQVAQTYCFDRELVFAFGKSQGAGLVGNILACDANMSTKFAGYALVAGTFYTDADPCKAPFEFEIPCTPSRTDARLIEVHGLRDNTANYEGAAKQGQCLPSIPWWVKKWAQRYQLSTTGETEQLLDNTPTTFITRYGSGDKRGIISHIYSENVGHEWPAIWPNDDNDGDVAEFEASIAILNFFGGYL